MKHLDSVNLILSDARGIYIPRDFVTNDANEIAWEHCAKWGLNQSNIENWIDAQNPEAEWYWDAWQWILDNAKFTDSNGFTYTLNQDGDLWGICFERMSDQEKYFFGFDCEVSE